MFDSLIKFKDGKLSHAKSDPGEEILSIGELDRGVKTEI